MFLAPHSASSSAVPARSVRLLLCFWAPATRLWLVSEAAAACAADLLTGSLDLQTSAGSLLLRAPQYNSESPLWLFLVAGLRSSHTVSLNLLAASSCWLFLLSRATPSRCHVGVSRRCPSPTLAYERALSEGVVLPFAQHGPGLPHHARNRNLRLCISRPSA